MEVFGTLLFWFVVAHALCDYPLQGDFLARAKNRHDPINSKERLWVWALPAHSAIHAGAVALISGSVVLGVVEFVLHNIIDYGKCEGGYGFHMDQAMHVACKVAYAFMLVHGAHP